MPGVTPYSAADLARLRSVQARPQGWTWRTRDQVHEDRDEHGRPFKVTVDQLGNRVRERWTGQDVRIMAAVVRRQLSLREVR